MRIAIGTICQETSTFTPVPTTWENWGERWGYLRGEAIVDVFRGANTPEGGFIDGAEAHGFEIVPTIAVEAQPSGPTSREIFNKILKDLLDSLSAGAPFDGVLLYVHGAMVAEGIDDADGHILEAVRKRIGPEIPIVAQLDIHSNVSKRMVEMADVLIGRRTYPEVDMAERGRHCADVLMRILRDGVRPTMALHQIPMHWGLNQVTAQPPMSEAIAELLRIESLRGVVCGSIATGFPLADIPDMGSSVYIVTDNDMDQAKALCDELGRWLFDRRGDWHSPHPTTKEALDAASRGDAFPVVLADIRDNTGGGSPGDSTGMLATFLEVELEDACVLYIVDPKAIEQCRQAGVGAILDLEVGGKSSPMQGLPCRMTAEVVALSDGRFRYDGPMFSGLEGDMGNSALIRQGGVHVVLVTVREQPFDTAFARSLGIDPQRMQYVGVKSSAHFRAAYGPWAGVIYEVSEPSVHNPTTSRLAYKTLGRKLYPIDNL
jgi:microcystin degradation protein MlrC